MKTHPGSPRWRYLRAPESRTPPNDDWARMGIRDLEVGMGLTSLDPMRCDPTCAGTEADQPRGTPASSGPGWDGKGCHWLSFEAL